MLIVKIGGPAYRIGMGGGAASSVPSGSNRADLDFNAVQVSPTDKSMCRFFSSFTDTGIQNVSCWHINSLVAYVLRAS